MKFHNGPNGPGVCKAKTRPCPFGGEEVHFTSMEAATEAYTETMMKENGLLPGTGDMNTEEYNLVVDGPVLGTNYFVSESAIGYISESFGIDFLEFEIDDATREVDLELNKAFSENPDIIDTPEGDKIIRDLQTKAFVKLLDNNGNIGKSDIFNTPVNKEEYETLNNFDKELSENGYTQEEYDEHMKFFNEQQEIWDSMSLEEQTYAREDKEELDRNKKQVMDYFEDSKVNPENPAYQINARKEDYVKSITRDREQYIQAVVDSFGISRIKNSIIGAFDKVK